MLLKKLDLRSFEEVRNGVPLRFKIQTITPDLIDDVLQHMFTHFLTREPITTYDHLLEDEQSVSSYTRFWRKTLLTGESMVALEERDDDIVNIVGVNITTVADKHRNDNEVYEGKVFDKVLKAVMNLTEIGNVYKTYDLDSYLTAYGLSVHSDYHGYNIGLRLLETREVLCQELGLKATATVFSNKVAQYLAAKAGYRTLAEQSFQTMEIDGQIAYPGVDGSLKLMGIKYV
ncbi:uncharacterized protein [Rhodnius prolixus]|uniref:uncharacterized protein n=1 Tax=Rhodnius prolixus TaxID=13249 RepID=UPI003D18FA25